jgi:hypothetical protein
METSKTFLTVLGKLKKKRKKFLANPIINRTFFFQKSKGYTRFGQLFFNRMGHLLTLPVMYDNIWIISFLKGGLGGVVRFGGLHAHRI